jgi:hypothetical protein
MVRSGSHKAVDRSQAEKYRRVGVSLLASARALESIAVTGETRMATRSVSSRCMQRSLEVGQLAADLISQALHRPPAAILA